MILHTPNRGHAALFDAALVWCGIFDPDMAGMLRFFAGDGALDPTKVKGARLGILRFLEYPAAMRGLAPKPGMTALDIGSNYRPWPLWMLSSGCEVTVSDLPEQAGELARYGAHDLVKRNAARFHAAAQDATRLEFSDASFDRVTCISVIEHIPDDAAVMRQIGRVLKPGGRAVLTFPVGRDESPDPANPFARAVERCYTRARMERVMVQGSGLTVRNLELHRIEKNVTVASYNRRLWDGAMNVRRTFRRVADFDALRANPLDTGVLVLERDGR